MTEATDPRILPELLDAAPARHPGDEAFVSVRRRATYAELRDDSLAIGRGLAARGVGRGTRVGLLMPNRAEWLATAFGVWRCGGVLVPLSTLARPRELAHFLRSADVALLVAVRRFLRHDYEAMLQGISADAAHAPAPVFAGALPALREVLWLDDDPAAAVRTLAAPGDALGGEWPGVLTARVSPADAATVTFTSGTTSEPKGAVHAHRALCRSASDVGATLGLDPSDRTWGYLPLFFNAGLVAVGLATLARGAAIVATEVFEPGEALRLLEAERCTVFFGWPHQAEALIQHPRFASTKLALHKGVGANVPWAARLYPPDHHAVATWGMTETGPMFTAWPSTAPSELRASGHGAPVAGREVRICDPASGEPTGAGAAGEICVRGPTLFSHYDGASPRDCFDAQGYFHTGDLGRLDEHGTLHFLGRIKDVIKTAGANVAAAEVEATLLRHPAVGAAHVVPVPAGARGEDVAAFVVATRPVAAEALLEHCRAELASYKVPRHLWFRREDELPLLSSGKVDKAPLRAEAARLAAA
ncbi:MAG: class I adenylate-forming enzyme family protein [Thermodesulfobacteriota bacterium]